MNLTKSQKQATDIRDCSLLVSAGAGSGKTAVLTQRIIDRLCDENDECNITDFLVVTFTNAAAKELSDRIRKKLSEAAKSNPQNKKITQNIALMPMAKISTINAFCYDIVRKNFESLDLSPSVRIGDEAEMKVLKERIMNQTLSDAFEMYDKQSTEKLIDVYEIFSSSRDDAPFVEVLLKIDAFLRADADPEALREKILDGYRDTCVNPGFFSSFYGKMLCGYTNEFTQEKIKFLETARTLSLDGGKLQEKYLPAIDDTIDAIKTIQNALCQDYEQVRKAVLSFQSPRFSQVRDYEDTARKELVSFVKSDVSKAVTEKLAPLYSADEKTLRACSYDCTQILTVLFSIVDEFSNRLEKTKKELGIVDFNDVEHYTIKLLGKGEGYLTPTETALSLRKKYKEIYIDEYQDVNALQDTIFKLLSAVDADGKEKSRFMVGDIKQSIYRFRGARPDIFKGYRDGFSEADSTQSTRKIFMQDNFRCSQHVISLTNLLFSRLMGKDYQTGDELLFSRIENVPTKPKAKFLLCPYDKEIAGEASSDQVEARLIGKKILEVVNNPEYTNPDGRMYGFADVAVLTREKKVLKTYGEVFLSMGIPYFSSVGESFYNKKEILLCLCILNSIDNPLRDVYLAGFLRSLPGGFTDDELCIIKNHSPKLYLYQSMRQYAQSFDGTELSQKINNFCHTLEVYRAKSRGKNAAEFLWELYCDMDLLNLCASPAFDADEPSVCADRRKNLLKLYDIARAFTKTSFHGLGAFIEYINGAIEKNDEKADVIMSGDCVSLMSIHASKGLEFPVCFVSSLDEPIKKEKDAIVFSYTSGIGFKLRDVPVLTSQKSATSRLSFDTPFRRLVAECENRDGIKEEMRILYVALTRAKDYLYMTSCEKNKLDKILNAALVNNLSGLYSNAQSFEKAILNCVADSPCSKAVFEYSGIDTALLKRPYDEMENHLECEIVTTDSVLGTSDKFKTEQNPKEAEDAADDALYQKLLSLGNFTYPYKALTRIPSKLTVSQLKQGLLDEDGEKLVSPKRDLKKEPLFFAGTSDVTAAEKGTAMHLFMQFCDFEGCEKNGAQNEAEKLLSEGFIDRRTYEMLDVNKLDEFFKTTLYGEIKRSPKVCRERRFNLATDASEYDKSVSKGTKMLLVQGVIDLYFENPDGSFTVVDFKTDNVYGNTAKQVLLDRHCQQLAYYCRAVSEITEKEVTKAYIFSFSLMDTVDVQV